MKRTALCLAICAAALVGSPQASGAIVTYTYAGPPVPIPDNDPIGVDLDISVADVVAISQFQRVSVTFSSSDPHTWAGDLVVTLTHIPTGSVIDLFRRIGSSDFLAEGGDSSGLNGTYVFSNIDALTNPAQPRLIDAGDPLDTDTDIPNGTYRPTTNVFNNNPSPTFSGETISDLNATFDAVRNVNGIWRLSISDNAEIDFGTIDSWSFTVNTADAAAVPEPRLLGAAAVAAFGVIVLINRRR